MTKPRRLLVDVREDDNLRGFHVLASLYLIADRLRGIELYRLGGDATDETIACQAFTFDTGLKFRRIWRLILADSKFDLYLSAANTLPRDAKSLAGRHTSRRSIVAVMFGHDAGYVNGEVVDGHNTARIAQVVADRLILPYRRASNE
jgi:hypothetical protein